MAENFDFSTSVHGKTILTGEHAVIRGNPAIIFPFHKKQLELSYRFSTGPVSVVLDSDIKICPPLFYEHLLEHALSLLNKPNMKITGTFYISNHIPISSGLGASAALSVAIAEWFAWQNWIPQRGIFEFAWHLEDYFHGKSSGADIAAVMSETPILFQHKRATEHIELQWKPKLYLQDSGQLGSTTQCVKQVYDLWERDPLIAKQLDENMRKSTEFAMQALQQTNVADGLQTLSESMQIAYQCFSSWGLCGGKVGEKIEEILKIGALAAKPTGSGNGGYILSLWEYAPPPEILPRLIPLFNLG